MRRVKVVATLKEKSYVRQVPLPAGIKSDTAEVTFQNGVLEIKMLATEKQSTARKLKIKDATDAEAAAMAAA